eukprot:jgi/Chlat1/7367/Chrsp59S06983
MWTAPQAANCCSQRENEQRTALRQHYLAPARVWTDPPSCKPLLREKDFVLHGFPYASTALPSCPCPSLLARPVR